MDRHIKIGPKLFAKEKSMYRDWVQALIRENIQNSVDAGATRIDINIEIENDLHKVTFSDNGPGMDMNTLENVYFVLGETTKTTANSIGGFGVARMLTCFAQEKYELRTQDILIEGIGASWTPQTGLNWQRGVSLTAWVNANGRNIEEVFKGYLTSCQISADVFLNGVQWKEWMHKNRHERSLSFGEVYTNKSKTSGIVVRSNGVTMFAPHLSAPFQVIIELDASRSREILQAHRDGLTYQFQSELESFISELNINKQSALREKRSKSHVYNGTGTFISKRTKKLTSKDIVESLENILLDNKKLLEDSDRKLLLKLEPEACQKACKKALEYLNITTEVVSQKVPQHNHGFIEETTSSTIDEIFSMIVSDQTHNPLVRKVIESYYPNNWDLQGKYGTRYDSRYHEFRSFRAGVDKYKLLVLWKAACENCIRILQDELHYGQDEIAWGIGWVFSDKAQAECKHEDVTWLLLNPVDIAGKMKFSISAKDDLIKLISNAAHEVCHIVYSDHDERFANLLNDLLEKVMIELGDVIGNMKKAKVDAEQELSTIAQ